MFIAPSKPLFSFSPKHLFSWLVLSLLLGIILLAMGITAKSSPPLADAFIPASADHTLPLAFTPNWGQVPEGVLFQARSFGSALHFMPDQVLWSLPRELAGETAVASHLQLQFLGTQVTPEIIGHKPLPGIVNYLLGDDSRYWLSNIPTYQSIVYRQLYPGIDLHYTGEQAINGQWALKGTYIVAPGADATQIQWSYQGANQVQLDEATGNLLISLSDNNSNTLTEKAPITWQDIDGKRVPVPSHYLLGENNSIHFSIGTYDPAYPLIIDPTLIFSTYLGTSTEDSANSVTVDDQGNIYVAGWTDSVTFPTTSDAFQPTSTGGTCFAPPPFNTPFPCNDGFISKLSPDGSTLLYSTYLGGTRDDGIRSIALDNNNNIYLTGWTTSVDFPTMNPIQPANGSGNNLTPDAFVARLAADGTALQYSTYLGGTGRDYGDNLAVDNQGNAYVIGWTESTNFPTANPVQVAYGGGFFDGTITKVNAAGDAFAYSSYLGGNNLDYAFGIDVDSNGSAYITGFTLSNDFPTFNAMQPTFGGGIEAYVTKLTPSGTAYVYSTYFGNNDTRGFDIRVNNDEYVYLVGATSSTTFPTVNPLQATYSGIPFDAFVSRFIPDGSAIDFSTYLGGNGNDVIHTLTLDDADNIHFIGWSAATDFPLSNAIQAIPGGNTDVIVGLITADLTTLGFSTYLGGTENDFGYAIAVSAGQAHIAGHTASADFPTQNPMQPTSAGNTDSFIAKIDLALPDIPQASFVSSSPDLLGETTIFTNTSIGGNLAYQWDFGDGSPIATDKDPTHQYPAIGSYTVTLTISNTFGLSTVTSTVFIGLAPQASFISSSPDALGTTTTFTNTSSGENLAYQWNFGDNSPTTTDIHPTHPYWTTGIYTVTLTVSNTFGLATATGIVEVGQAPQASFISSSPDALGATTIFTNSSSGENLAYHWDFGDSTSDAIEAHPTHHYSATGSYTVTLTISNTFGLSSVAGTVDILLLPQANFVSSSPDFLGSTTVFTNSSIGSNLTYQWDFGDGSSPITVTNPSHIYANVGVYSVTLTAVNPLGSSTITGTVEITELSTPPPTFTLFLPVTTKD